MVNIGPVELLVFAAIIVVIAIIAFIVIRAASRR
jgi:hypothetical protein